MKRIHIDIEKGDDITCEDFGSVSDAKEFLDAMDDTSFERTWGLTPKK